MNFVHWIVIMKRGFAGATNTRIVFALFQLWIIIMINLSETFTENTCIVVRNINNYRYFRPSSRVGTTKWTMTELHRVCNDFNEDYLVCEFAHHIYGLVFRVWIFHMWHFIWLRLFFRHIITHSLSLRSSPTRATTPFCRSKRFKNAIYLDKNTQSFYCDFT